MLFSTDLRGTAAGKRHKMKTVLSIGNSFSQDAHRYLHRTAAADGEALTTVNLYIGGCSLWRHYRNLKADSRDYSLEFNGEDTGFRTTIREALLSRHWDVVTLQQLSSQAPDFSTYEPYLSALAAAVRELCPGARLALHETWAYAEGSARLHEELGYAHHGEMTRDLVDAYAAAVRAVGADFVIPSGRAMEALQNMGVPAHRDGFHASLGTGRYALALTWLRALTGRPAAENRLGTLDVPASAEELAAARRAADEAFLQNSIQP